MLSDQYQDCLKYIDKYWERIIFRPSKMKLRSGLKNVPILISSVNHKLFKNKKINKLYVEIPHYYFVPNDRKFKYIFYWDSYFMFKGLVGTKREWLMKEMVENFIYLFNYLQIIPNFSSRAALGRSQPPFLSSMIMETYKAPINRNNYFNYVGSLRGFIYKLYYKRWLKRTMEIAQQEYELVWIDKDCSYNHSVQGYKLSRYGDRDIGYAHSSELESGWDMTSRFYSRCNEFLPVDLNSYLYKYETDFAEAAKILENKDDFDYWIKKAKERQIEINKYMWDEHTGFFYDYGYYYKRLSKFLSLAGFAPMWAGLATADQAERMIKKLPKFETKYGLAITAKESLAHQIDLSKIQTRFRSVIESIIKPKQWDYPNIWSPLEYLTVIGLLRYGYIDDAKRIMTNSINAHATAYRKHKTFFEKLSGETGESGSGALYRDQDGFGWTNAVFYRYIKILEDIENLNTIYEEPLPAEPPYALAILH